MKNNIKQSKHMNLLKSLALMGTFSLMLVSCMKDNTDDKSALYEEQFQQMKKTYGITSSDSIGYNVFMKFLTDTTDADSTRATADNAVLFSYSGYDYSGAIMGTTYPDTALAKNIYMTNVVYGPVKYIVKYLIGGLWEGLINMPINSKAIFIFPSNMAYNTGPVKYVVELHQIITNQSKNEEQQRSAYMDTIGFFNGNVKTAIDSTLWYKFIAEGGHDELTLDYGNTVTIELKANYCEFLPGVLTSNPGRQFFKINNVNDTISYIYLNNNAQNNFPITPAIDSMVTIMNIAGYRQAEFITTSANAYGSVGYVHPVVPGNYVIPPYTSIHYTLRLVKIVD
jgi:hypothetical protein